MTVSLVTCRHTLDKIRPIVDSVLGSANLEKFTVIDNSGDGPLRGELEDLTLTRRARASRAQCVTGCAREGTSTTEAATVFSLDYIPSENRGFGAAHNIALRAAMESGAKYHAIVNPDTWVAPGTFEAIEAYLDAHADIGVLMPKTIYPDGRMQYNAKLLPSPLDSIGRRFLPKSWTAKRNARYELRHIDHEKSFDCAYLCGCFLVFRLDCLREVGLFDERFFMYPEDIDISRRIYSSKNWRSVYWPGATVVHAHEKASYKSWKMTWIHIRNMIKYFNKWGWLFDAERRRINREVLAAVDADYSPRPPVASLPRPMK